MNTMWEIASVIPRTAQCEYIQICVRLVYTFLTICIYNLVYKNGTMCTIVSVIPRDNLSANIY